MATFKICVFKKQKRTDGKFRVVIRVTWRRQSAYIKTEYYVTSLQLTKGFEVKDTFILRQLNMRILNYEALKSQKLGQNIELYTAKQLADYFIKHTSLSDNTICFSDFIEAYVKKTNNKGTAGIYSTVLNSLKRFTGTEKIYCSDITLSFLQRYEQYLFTKKSDTEEPLKPTGVHLYMRTLKALFNKARLQFNDEERGDVSIPLNPFRKYKFPALPSPESRSIPVDKIRAIRDIGDLKYPKEILARDVFMLSLCLAGINTADLYNCTELKAGRLNYNRTKTKDRRPDKAYMSIRIEPEAAEIIKKYRDPSKQRVFSFYKRFADTRGFNKAVNKGLKMIAERFKWKIDLKYYCARHSWASIARNECGINKYDVHEALNHSDPEMKITDIYIKKDWGNIDKANRAVIDYVNKEF